MCFPSKASFGTAADLGVTGIEEKFERKNMKAKKITAAYFKLIDCYQMEVLRKVAVIIQVTVMNKKTLSAYCFRRWPELMIVEVFFVQATWVIIF